MEERKRIEAMSKKELCNLLNISYHTLKAWTKPIQKKLGSFVGGKYTPAQLKIIFEHIGYD